MIPDFTQSGVLPPFDPISYPHKSDGVSPYRTTLREFVDKFSTNNNRKGILTGFISYRLVLKDLGITSGFQWIDGSFVEDIERTQQRFPSDLDIVTFAKRPVNKTNDDDWLQFFSSNQNVFDPKITKTDYKCDAYYIDLNLPAVTIVKRCSYWYGLFSHQRATYLWKGLLEIPIFDKDDEMLEELINGGENAS